MTGDQKGRAKKFDDLGMPLDETVKPYKENE